jgi:hypothetical protein
MTKKVKFTAFGKTKLVPHRTFTNNKEDVPPKETWDDELWIERGEDWYGLMYYARKKKVVLVVEREDWIRAKEVSDSEG